MPGIPDLIMKPAVFERMEKLSRDSKFWESEAARDALKIIAFNLADKSKSILDIAKSGWLYDHDSTEHFAKHWLNRDKDGYWSNIQDKVEACLRAGMKLACEIFIGSSFSKPFEYLWVITGPVGSTEWQMAICEGDDQVTVIFQTPQTNPTTPNYIYYPYISLTEYDPATKTATPRHIKVPV